MYSKHHNIKANLALLDSGASDNFISEALVNKNPLLSKLPKYPYDHSFETAAADGKKLKFQYVIRPTIYIEGHPFVVEFMVSSNMTDFVILGIDFLQKNQIVMDFWNSQAKFGIDNSITAKKSTHIPPGVTAKIVGYINHRVPRKKGSISRTYVTLH